MTAAARRTVCCSGTSHVPVHAPACAQVGAYAFTTIRPQLGAISASSCNDTPEPCKHSSSLSGTGAAAAQLQEPQEQKGQQEQEHVWQVPAGKGGGKPLVLADIPGLVQGAHQNR